MKSTLLTLAALLCVAGAVAQGRSSGREPAHAGQFDYYLLTLSWSPTYCLTHGNDRSQCSGKGYGFVLHGLWPQYNDGGYPERCPADQRLSHDAEVRGQMVFISPTLMRHEWEAHGTCSGLDAQRYFETADRALASMHIPQIFDAPLRQRSLTAAQIIDQFRRANPTLPTGSLVVACGRGELTEVRVCLTRDLQPRQCGRGVRTSCPSAAVEIPSRR